MVRKNGKKHKCFGHFDVFVVLLKFRYKFEIFNVLSFRSYIVASTDIIGVGLPCAGKRDFAAEKLRACRKTACV